MTYFAKVEVSNSDVVRLSNTYGDTFFELLAGITNEKAVDSENFGKRLRSAFIRRISRVGRSVKNVNHVNFSLSDLISSFEKSPKVSYSLLLKKLETMIWKTC